MARVGADLGGQVKTEQTNFCDHVFSTRPNFARRRGIARFVGRCAEPFAPPLTAERPRASFVATRTQMLQLWEHDGASLHMWSKYVGASINKAF